MKTGIVFGIKSLLLLVCLNLHGMAAELSLAQAPLRDTYEGPPNVMLLIDTSESMTAMLAGGQKKRIDVARKVASDLVSENPKVRFGLARLNGWHGAYIDCYIGSDCPSLGSIPQESLLNRLDRYDEGLLTRGTPMAEALYEVTRYFRGMDSFDYADGMTEGNRVSPVPYRSIKYESPVQHRCQKNYVIALTDGKPAGDDTFATDDKADKDIKKAAWPSWDASTNDLPEPDDRAGRLWSLDGIAQFAWYLPQKIRTHHVSFANDSLLLGATAVNGHSKYYTAGTADELSTVLARAINALKSKSLSSSVEVANSGRVQKDSWLFQAGYNVQDWSGQLLAFDIIADPGAGDVAQVNSSGDGDSGLAWDAGKKIPDYAHRVIITNKGEKGIQFNWGAITDTALSDSFDSEDQLQYFRGKNVSDYRPRSSKLGDIVNSAPVYVGQPDARYRDDIEIFVYKSFRQTYLNRTPIIYVGANDGMLHGFDAVSGVEKLAYIPGHLLPKLKRLANKDYSHQYYVDGTPTVVDAFVAGEWKTILVGGLNAGGQSVYALDVSNPENFSQSNANSIFMWEFTDEDDADLGYTFSIPKIVKIKDGNWYSVFGNGYNNTEDDGSASASGDAVIYIVDLATGKLASKVTTEVGWSEDPTGQERPNGMATLTPVDIDGDSIADAIYGGDLFGNVWKVDLSSGLPQHLSKASRLFTACAENKCEGDYRPQPITSQLAVNRIEGETIVLFGTGKYVEITDANSTSPEVQSFYGIWDEGVGFSGRGALQRQTIKQELTISYNNRTDAETYEYVLRTTSDNQPDLNTKGWYIDLVTPVVDADAEERGERIIHRPVLRNGRVVFLTTTPAQEYCGEEGSSWLMELDQATGGRPALKVFNLDKNGTVSSSGSVHDNAGNKIAVSGEKRSGNVALPAILDGENSVANKYLSGDSETSVVKEVSGDSRIGRLQWQQFTRE